MDSSDYDGPPMACPECDMPLKGPTAACNKCGKIFHNGWCLGWCDVCDDHYCSSCLNECEACERRTCHECPAEHECIAA